MNTPEDLGVFTVDDLLSELRQSLETLNKQAGEVLAGTTDSAGGVFATNTAEAVVACLRMLQERAWPMVRA